MSVTPKAKAVLLGDERVYQRVAAAPPAVDTSEDDAGLQDLFDQLRQLRKSFAERERVPPFTIFHDATLREMCRRLPRTENDMLDIKGVGANKHRKYGEAFMACIDNYVTENAF